MEVAKGVMMERRQPVVHWRKHRTDSSRDQQVVDRLFRTVTYLLSHELASESFGGDIQGQEPLISISLIDESARPSHGRGRCLSTWRV